MVSDGEKWGREGGRREGAVRSFEEKRRVRDSRKEEVKEGRKEGRRERKKGMGGKGKEEGGRRERKKGGNG